MLTHRTQWIVAIAAMLYLGYLATLVGLKFFYTGEYLVYLQAALVWFTLVVVAFLDRKFELF